MAALSARLGVTLDATCTPALRESVRGCLRDQHVVWLRLDGLSLDSALAHGALCRSLQRCGIGSEPGVLQPVAVVLDWSVTPECGAEGAAYFRVLIEQLAALGIALIACAPSDAGLGAMFDGCGLMAEGPKVLWVPCARAGRTSCEALGGLVCFSRDRAGELPRFLDDLAGAVERLGCARPLRQAVMGAASELLGNVRSHAGATTAAAVATLLPRRRPRRLQLGVADDGVGIPASLLLQAAHQDLQIFSDGTVTQAVLGYHLSGRQASSTQLAGGGGLSRLFRRLLDQNAGSRVLLRSGSAFFELLDPDPRSWSMHHLTAGSGTQVRLELKLR